MRNRWIFEVEFNPDTWDDLTELEKAAKLDEVTALVHNTDWQVLSISPSF